MTNNLKAMPISARALNQAKDQALRTVGRAKVYWSVHPECTWKDLENNLGLSIPEQFRNGSEIIKSRSDLDLWATWYKGSVEARLNASLASTDIPNAFQAAKAEVAAAKDITNFTTFGEFTLLPEQQAAYDAIVRDFFVLKKHRAGMQDGRTGSGKTPLALALIHHVIHSGELDKGFYVYPIMIFCPVTLAEHWYRHIERAGLGKYIGNTIQTIPYSALSATEGRIYIKENLVYDFASGKDVTVLEWSAGLVPYLAIFDECHRLNNDSYQTKAILALLRTKNAPYSLWMSATPFVTVNNTRAFVIATKARLLDMTITEESFSRFAGLICEEPNKPNLAAAKRLRTLLGPFIYSMPKAKWPHKAINAVLLVDFRTDEDRALYDAAYAKYLEKCKLLGKNTDFGRFEQFVALGQFRKAVEPVRMDQVVDRCHKHIVDGKESPVIGCVYRDSVIRAVFRLIELGYKRSDISVIWGGREEIKTNLVLSDAEFNELFQKSLRGEEFTKLDVKRMTITLQFKEEKASYSEKKDEQTLARLARVAEFGLMGSQTPNQRQCEIDRFQSGESKICIFTLAAGGVGLSLDQSSPNLLPRVGYFTPTYSGPEFQQALGRLPRRMTLSDTYQFIVGMVGTIEETHVMPLIDKKLRCIAEITNSDYSLIDFHKAKVVELDRVRSIEEAIRDSDDERTQLHEVGNESDEEKDDDESNT